MASATAPSWLPTLRLVTVSGTNDTGAKMYTIGYDYALSKRTSVGAYYSRLDNDTNGAYQPFLAGTSFTGSGLSLRRNRFDLRCRRAPLLLIVRGLSLTGRMS